MSRIFLVEDHRVFSASIAHLLDQEPDLEVVGAAHSASECRAFLEKRERFDVAVVDLYLPDGEGTDLISELRESQPAAAVMILTISVDPDDWTRAKERGANEIVSKATDPDDIISTIKSIAKS